MGLKNIWSLTVDEVLVADKLKQQLQKKDYEVFFPLNTQLKDIDLIVYNLKKAKSLTIQVKGSRTYEPRKSEVAKFGDGSAAWITISKNAIFRQSNKVDFFIFALHSFVDAQIKKEIAIDYLVLPMDHLRKIVKQKILRKGNKYHFFIWLDSKGKRSFDFNNPGGKTIQLTKYLNNWNSLI